MEINEFYDFIVKVHSIAKIGLTYSTDPYAIENYNELNELSKEMLEKFMNVKFDRPSMFTKEVYPTPNVSVRAVIGRENKILLVREANSGKWSLPGGWCDLYETPSESAFKEVSQEAGIEPNITRLIGIIERSPIKSGQNVSEYIICFEGNVDGKEFHEHCHETTEVKFFDVDNLPEMSKKVECEDLIEILDAFKNKKVIFD